MGNPGRPVQPGQANQRLELIAAGAPPAEPARTTSGYKSTDRPGATPVETLGRDGHHHRRSSTASATVSGAAEPPSSGCGQPGRGSSGTVGTVPGMAIARFPSFVLETDAAFYALLPNAINGECPQGQFVVPVYRLWNARADTNHRYTTSLSLRDTMVAQGYVSEGYGPYGVAFCVPTF